MSCAKLVDSHAALGACKAFTLGHRPVLDGVRGLAILFVLSFHFHLFHFTAGMIGVDLFFCLSGFLITRLLIEEYARTRKIDLPRFLLRRTLRLWPALFAYIGCAQLAARAFPVICGQPLPLCRTAGLIYIANWWLALHVLEVPMLYRHCWSLAVEKQFYLLWPCLLLLLQRFRRRVVGGFLLCGWLYVTCIRAWLWHAHVNWDRTYFATDTRADGLLAGCFLALFVDSKLFLKLSGRPRWASVLGLLSLTALLSVAGSLGNHANIMHYVGYTTDVTASCGLIISLLVPSAILTEVFEHNWLRYLGRVSYSLYLWNGALAVLVQAHNLSKLENYLCLMFALVLGHFSYSFVERPFIRLKRSLSN